MLDPAFHDRLDGTLAADDAEREHRYPGSRAGRQPVHTVYVPADRFAEHTVAEWRSGAIATLDQYGPMPGVGADLESRVRDKLAVEPIEDLRIDFEDGYGARDDTEEDEAAGTAARALARSADRPGFVGLRMKSLESSATRRRGLRTLELFLDAFLGLSQVPPGFRVTLPKVTSVRQVEAMVEICAALESAYSLPLLHFEIQIETPQSILGADGTALVARMVHASAGRCVGLHYGTYDYSAALGISAAYQSMEHPAADHAKAIMQLAAAGTGVPVSDGSTNVVPVGEAGRVRAAWELHLRLVRRSLERGFYQGWDLHPAQLPSRFAATFAFYRDGRAAAIERLHAYLDRQAGGILDEPATARALAGYLVRGIDAGALDGDVTAGAVGVGSDELLRIAGRPSG